MFNRGISTRTIRWVSVNRSCLNTFKLRATQQQKETTSRFYSTSGGSGGKTNHFIPLTLLGIGAIGLTYYNMNNNSKPPLAAIDPTNASIQGSPLFPSDKYPESINIVFVLGGPGSGKGTQCAKLVDDFKFIHLSAGDLLRKEQNTPGSEFGDLIAHFIKEGLIVPQEITINLLKNAIAESYEKNGGRNFLIDGFPRKMDQALSFEKIVSEGKLVLYFECPEEVMLQRLLNRGKTSGRADDNLESIKKRFTTFIQTSMPVVEYFADQNKVVKVNCNEPVDAVYKHVVQQFKEKKII
ncbi:bifunctional uridylate/adenylate kinase [Pichia californica]|uniref:Uridylate kinase n=1 Tax=Pichia californica TaxID=460514 RepID=A0A9P6WGQ2_9ASCO|nr:bifunctional uridylate/adenylate kinase [[Candida] californica]KAG0686865.1 bifunctional uridylate/adenylate kinase [[Candida] californica]